MSLIQDALERAITPEPEVPQAVAVHEEPRLQNIKYYEAAAAEKPQAKVWRAKANKKSFSYKIPNVPAHYRLPVFITGLILISLLARLFFFNGPSEAKTLVMPSRSVVVKAQTPVTQKMISQAKFTLTGITRADGLFLALINNQVVGEGDSLREGAVVKTITEDTATLEWQNRPVSLSL
jgi:hypothetical protein